jgi:GTP-binding protein HflX
MNYLTDAGVLAQDKLFATLDPTSRALKLPSGVTVMMIDTVGLVRRLPHHLVEAFRSTLEEAAQSDIILNVCDASSDEARTHMQVTTDLLESLGCGDTPIITVLNKCDLLDETMLAQDFKACVRISAKNGTGIDELLNAIENNLPVRMKRVKILLFYYVKFRIISFNLKTKFINRKKNKLEKEQREIGRIKEFKTKYFE